MVKPDYSRDYYADLELPATAEAIEIKKQFKKLGQLCRNLSLAV
jgi:curved DNA-binding protein CbpA